MAAFAASHAPCAPGSLCAYTASIFDSRASAEILTFMRRAVEEMGQTIVMVTHDPVAAAYAQRVVFLADGRIVDEMSAPTAERVLDRMKRFGA